MTILLRGNKKTWPYNACFVNEEMLFIFEGEGTLELPGEVYHIKAGRIKASEYL